MYQYPSLKTLSPPYTPAPVAAVAPAAAPANGGVTLSFDIPINSNVIGATPVTRAKHYGRAVPFSVRYTEICDMMGLDSMTAVLGYKWDNEKRNDPVHGLANAADWNNCLEKGIGQTTRARTQQVTCVIKNLNLPEETASGAEPTASKKRKAPVTNPSDDRKTFDFTKEYHTLKEHLSCATHKGQLCFISTLDGHHHCVEPYHASLWAKEISHILDENSISEGVSYPPVTDILQLIDNSGIFDDSAVLPFPTIIFADALDEYQITRVDHVPLLNMEFYVHQINMPEELATLFVEESILVLTRARKGKGRATEF
ncbi:hypothetical protein B0H17DRAFT_1179900 [Mycena rosella]|uniref:Uncharacterized protein n=1 Tax=Mycena rosella TaxID=1033263 RepID=A0AAD7DHD9_MYCRO|nr:hypothetical protein B0H17DRAFT_1179900 [Mycena rosella]